MASECRNTGHALAFVSPSHNGVASLFVGLARKLDILKPRRQPCAELPEGSSLAFEHNARMQDRTPTPTAALLSFHLKAGSRLAMRTGVPAAALLTAGIGLSPDPGATLRLVANDLASNSGSFIVGVLLAIVAGGMATWAAPRIYHGVNGWVRHLPADWPAHRRALLGALTAAELPVAITWCALWLVAWSLGSDVEPRRLLAMPVVLVGVSLTCVPARWPIVVASAGVVTVGLGLFAGWPGLALAVVVALAAERLIVPPRGRTLPGVLWRFSVAAGLVPGLIAFRAIGRRLLRAYAPILIPLGTAWFFMRN